jgi:hypothetical protein
VIRHHGVGTQCSLGRCYAKRARTSFYVVVAIVAWASIVADNTTVGETVSDKSLFDLAKNRFGASAYSSPEEEKFFKDSEEEKLFEDLFRNAEEGQDTDRIQRSSNESNEALEKENDPGDAAKWKAGRVIRAEWLKWLCADPKASAKVSSRGISILGVRIDGKLDLSWAKIQFPFRVSRCAFTDKIVLNRAILRSLILQASRLKGLEGDGLNVERDVILTDGSHSEGEVWLRGAVVGGSVDCHGSEFINRDAIALILEDANIGNSILFTKPFEAEGLVKLDGAVVKGGLDCSGARFRGLIKRDDDKPTGHNVRKIAIDAKEIQVIGSVLLKDNFDAQGMVVFDGAKVNGDLDCRGGHFVNPDQESITATSAKIDGNVWLNDRCELSGIVTFKGAQIDHALLLKGAVWHKGATLDLRSAKARLFKMRLGWSCTAKRREPCEIRVGCFCMVSHLTSSTASLN